MVVLDSADRCAAVGNEGRHGGRILFGTPDASRDFVVLLDFGILLRSTSSLNSTLEEIARLLEMRADPQHARDEVRELAHLKLQAVTAQLEELETLRRELTLLVNLCRGAEEGCPIIEDLEN